MPINVSTTLIARPPDQMILIVKASRGTFRAPWDAARAVEALRAHLPSDQLHLDVVAMDGEPTANPQLFGLSASTAYVRSALATMANCTWTPMKLDW